MTKRPEVLVTEAQLNKADVNPAAAEAAEDFGHDIDRLIAGGRAFPHDDATVQELFRRMRGPSDSLRGGDRAALRDRLVLTHTPLVDHCARSFVATGEPIEDLVQEGYIGLIKAVDRFDPDKGIRFSTYACHLIAGEMRHYLRDLGKLIHEPGWHGQLRTKVVRESESLTQRLGRPPETEEIAQALDLQPRVVRAVLETHNLLAVESLDAPQGESDDGARASHEERAVSPGESHTTAVENHLLLDGALPKLRELEQRAIRLFYYHERTKTEIARELGISVNYAAYLVKRGIESLRKVIEEQEVGLESLVVAEVAGPITLANLAAWLGGQTVKMPEYAVVVFRILNWTPATARLGEPGRLAAEKAAEELTRRCCRLSDKVVPLAADPSTAIADDTSLNFVGLLSSTDKRGRRAGERWADGCTSRAVSPANPAAVDALLCDYLFAISPAAAKTPEEVVAALLAQF